MSEANSLPAAGWYPDPADSSRIRWWDGQAWTQHVAVADGAVTPAAPVVTPAPSSVPAPAPAPQKAGRNIQTKLTLWAGLFAAVALWAFTTLLTTMP